jgi:DNA mismatch repair protein MutL
MNRIALLSEQVANQIAAGEVIERPASVLKELIENSLDAKATQVDVQVRGGGRSVLLVTDNGWGMSKDDALLCLERHATSKLKTSDDLMRIASYGFRGEAIPSIASVSKFRLRSREPEAIAGTEVIVSGGKLVDVHETGMAPGSQIEVRSLFFNMPARRKFLRTEATETAHIKQQMILAALARADVGFSVIYDDGAPERWPAGQALRDRIASIYGEEFVRQMVPLEAGDGSLRLSGFVGQPGISRASRQEEHVFVNGRPVIVRTIQFALQEGYHNSLMRGRFPVCVLFLEMDPDGVDVNIHPAKREVRFHDDMRVRQFVVQAVQRTLQEFHATPVAVQAPAPWKPAFYPAPQPPSFNAPLPPMLNLRPELTAPQVVQSDLSIPASVSYAPPVPPRPHAPENALGLRVLGVVANLYLICEGSEGMVLIDQHAAHERVLFEEMLRRVSKQEVLSQKLLLPVTIQLPPREADFLKDQLETLNQIGVGINEFGAGTFLIDALPPMVKTRDVAEFMRTLVVDLEEAGGETRKSRRLGEEVIAKTVCRHAVKANDTLRPDEWDKLVKDLLECDLPYTCPHGRPTMIQMGLDELEKKFGRVQE